jgi:hypothetical protein
MTIPRAAILFLLLAIGAPATAGPYADKLAQCLVESTSQRDRIDLVRWMFASAAQHPAVAPYSTVTAEELDAVNKQIAELFTELLTEACVEETGEALQIEGESTLETAFSVLGGVAGQELFASPEVAASMAGLDKYIDEERLQEAFSSE